MHTYKYTVVKFVPDAVRNEPRNIGVILHSPDTNYIDSMFYTKLSKKVGANAKGTIAYIRDYISSFEREFKLFSSYPNPPFEDKKAIKHFDAYYLDNLVAKSSGSLQFELHKIGRTDDFSKTLKSLYDRFVNDISTEQLNVEPHHRLKTDLKNEFVKKDLLAYKEDGEYSPGFIENQSFTGQSNVKRPVHFSHQNGVIHAVEAVDFRNQNFMTQVDHTASIFSDLYKALGRGLIPISVVVKPQGNDTEEVEDGVKILNLYSTCVEFDDVDAKEDFLGKMREVVHG